MTKKAKRGTGTGNSGQSEQYFLTISQEEARNKIEQQIHKGEALKSQPLQNRDKLVERRNEYYRWSSFNAELLKRIFSTTEISEEYSQIGIMVFGAGRDTTFSEDVEKLSKDIKNKIHRLQSILDRIEIIPVDPSLRVLPQGENNMTGEGSANRNVFIVHGRDEAAKSEVARVLAALDFNPIILHEQANKGRTIIAKFSDHSEVGFAVVILSPDDEGRLAESEEELKRRARQNVIFELGYFIGRLGASRVCALRKGNVETPSDFDGVSYVSMSGDWKIQLVKELRSAGLEVDANKLY